MNCGGRHFCPGCGEELIHRDNRKPWESASAFGQIVWRLGPRNLTTGDIDHYAWRSYRSGELLRLIEHKQPGADLKEMQQKVLLLLDSVIRHAAHCPHYTARRLDDRSGVYVIRGEIHAAASGLRATDFYGPQTVTRAVADSFDPGESHQLRTAEEVFCFLEGARSAKDSGPRRRQRLPAVAQTHLFGDRSAA